MIEEYSDKKKQVFWYNFANYFSYFLVFISIAFLYDLNIEMVGKIKYVESIAAILMPFLTLGLSQAFVNFFPILEEYHGKTLYGLSLSLVFFISCAVAILLIIVNFFYPIHHFGYYLYGVIISSALSFLEIIKSRAITLNKVIRPVLFEKISPKIFLIVILVVFGKLTYDSDVFLKYYSIFYFVIILYLFSYLNKFSRPRFSFKTEHLFENFKKKDLYRYMFYSVLSSFLSFLAFKLEGVIIPLYFSMKANGLFGIAMFVSSFVALPAGAVFAINSPKVSSLMKFSSFAELNIIYKEVAKYIFYKCFIILSIIVCVLPQIANYFYSTNSDYLDLIPVIFALSVGSIFAVSTGFNNEIIMFSKYYKINYFFTALLVVVNLSLFYYFLKFTNLKLVGIAIAVSTSMMVFNTIKMLFIYSKFKLLPIDLKYIILVFAMSAVLLLVYIIPSTSNVFADIIIKVSLIFILNFFVRRVFKLINLKKVI